MNTAIKRRVLASLKRTGSFGCARYLTRRGLRILGYHGIALADEHRFNPMLFMQRQVFYGRMQRLHRLGLPVVSLDDVLTGDYPDCAVVITFDDGWAGTGEAIEILHEFQFPATLYVTTYYAERGTQVFNVLVHYLAWRSQVRIDLSRWDGGLGSLREPSFRERVLKMGNALTWKERQLFAEDLCCAVNLPGAVRLFKLMSLDELQAISGSGIDLQLHTHRHHFRADDTAWNLRELRDNRDVLSKLSARQLRHFCYPSGRHGREQFAALADAGIITATTTERGLNFAGTHPLAMRRFLDSDETDPLVFEAELLGVLDLLRSGAMLRSRRPFRAPEL